MNHSYQTAQLVAMLREVERQRYEAGDVAFTWSEANGNKWLEKERDVAKEISGNFELPDDVRKKYHLRHEVLVEIRHRFIVGECP